MRSYEVVVGDQADQDLREIFDYIAFELLAPESAAAQLDRLEEAIEKLATLPERHRRYGNEPWRSRNLRMFPVDNYCVFYIPDDESLTVTVIRVIYSGRDIDAQLDRLTRREE